jgi:hypothetical protein
MERVSVKFGIVIGRCVLTGTALAASAHANAQPRYALGVTKWDTAAATAPAATSTLLSVVGRKETPRPAGRPANLQPEGRLQRVMERMWEHSPTFRRQCARLAQTSLPVTLRIRWFDRQPFRALSRIEAEDGRLKQADVQINARHSFSTVELIAHELEHLIEIVDGVDLALQVKRGVATRTGPRCFETQRADEVGKRVAREVQRSRERRGTDEDGEGR